MVLKSDGSVWAAGANFYGQLGDGTIVPTDTFVKTLSGGVKAMAAGDFHSLVIKQDGSLWATGHKVYGQLGDGSEKTKIYRYTYIKVVMNRVTAVAAGEQHSLCLKQDGSVWATGSNSHGQLGDGSTTDRVTFGKVVDGGVQAVAAGNRRSMILKRDGTLWGTGRNNFGQLGDGLNSEANVFVKIILSDGECTPTALNTTITTTLTTPSSPR